MLPESTVLGTGATWKVPVKTFIYYCRYKSKMTETKNRLEDTVTAVAKSDIEDVLEDKNICWEELRCSIVLITGANGLIGSALVRTLQEANERYDLNINIIAHTRQTYGDIRNDINLAVTPDYIFHCASITKSSEMVSNPVDVMEVAIIGTRNVLNLASISNIKSIVFLSSMEVYGDMGKGEVYENDLGYIDLSIPRSSYPESKRCCESLCTAYYNQYNVPVKIARLARTFGVGVHQADTRVFAQFARSAVNGLDIELHTKGKSIGNYCYISDAIRGLLILLLKGENGQAYNIANPDASMTIRQMAELVADKVCGGKIEVVVNVPEDIKERGYLHDVGFVLNIDKIKKLGWWPKYGLCEMYKRMIAHWQHNGFENLQ